MSLDLRRLPKVELHSHLDGAVRPETALAIARRIKHKLPADDAAGLKPFLTAAPTCASLPECLRIFERVYPLLRDAESVERVAYELVEDSARDAIYHLEVRFAPQLQAHGKFPEAAVLAAAARGLARGGTEFGVRTGIILCLIRGLPRAANERTLKLALQSPQVVGLDLAGDEAAHPLSETAALFERAHAAGLPTTCHAGEVPGGPDVALALGLGVSRLGHGVHVAEKERSALAARKIPVEISLTSNLRTKAVSDLGAHPARALHQAGVPIVFNTDDRAIMDVDLTHEYGLARELGFRDEELTALADGAAAYVFAPRA